MISKVSSIGLKNSYAPPKIAHYKQNIQKNPVNLTQDVFMIPYSPKIIFKGKAYTPSENFEMVTKENIDKLVPLYRSYQENMNQIVDNIALKNYINIVLNNNHKIFMINQNDEPKGFIHISTSYSTIDMCPFTTIQSVFVKKDERGKGYARKLIEEVQKWTKFHNYKGVFVKTIAKNEAAVGMYTKMNFHNESTKYGVFFWANDNVLDYKQGYVNTKK